MSSSPDSAPALGEEWFRSTFEYSRIGMGVVDREGRFVEANRALLKMLGYSRPEFIGKHFLEVTHPAHHERDSADALRLRDGEIEFYERETRFFHRDGHVVWVAATASVVHDEAGNSAYFVVQMRDITHQRRLEAELRESESQFRKMFEATSDGVIINDPDTGIVVEANPAAARLHGYTREEFIGMDPRDFVHTDSLPLFEEFVRTVRAGGQFRTYARDWHKDGSVIEVEVVASPVDYHGKRHLLAVLRDVSTHRRLEQELKESEAELRALFAAIPDLIFVIARDGRFLRIAPTDTSNLPIRLERLMGRRIADLIPPKEAEEMVGAIERALDSRQPQTVQYNVEVQGEERWYTATISPMLEHTVVWVARDVTQEVRSKELLEKAVEERTRELSALLDVSHRVAATLDLEELLAVILDQLRTIVDYSAATVFDLHEDEIRALEYHGRDGRRTENLARYKLDEVPVSKSIIETRRYVVVDDVWAGRNPKHIWEGEFETQQTYAWLGVPLIARDRVIGLLSLEHEQRGYFTTEHADLTRAFAEQAAVAIENARLFEQTTARVRELEAIAEVATSLTFDRSLQETLDALAAVIVRNTRAVAAIVNLMSEQPDGTRALGSSGMPPGYTDALEEGWAAGGESGLGPVFRSGQTLVLPSLLDLGFRDPRMARARAILEANALFESVAVVPVMYRDSVLGVIVAGYRPGEAPDPAEKAFLDAISKQFAVSIENARLFADAERHTTELSTLLRVSSTLSSTLELRPLLDLILMQLKTVAPHDGDAVYLLDGDALLVIASSGEGSGEETIGDRYPLEQIRPMWEILSQREPILIGDIHDDSLVSIEFRRAAATALETTFRNIHSWLGVPMVLKDEVVGVLGLSSSQRNAFTLHHADLAIAFASQAAIAIDNASLFTSAEERARELSTLLTVSRELGSTLDLDRLLGLILAQLDSVAPHESSGVYYKDGESAVMIAGVLNGGRAPVGARYPINEGGPLWNQLMARLPVIIDDVRGDSELARDYQRGVGDQLYGILSFIRGWMAVPLFVKGELLGFVTLTSSKPGFFTQRHGDLATAIANQASVAISNANLFAEAEQRAAENQALANIASSLTFAQSTEVTLTAMASSVVDSTSAAACAITLIDPENQLISMAGTHGLGDKYVEVLSDVWQMGGSSPVIRVFQTGRPRIVRGARAVILSDPMYAPIHDYVQSSEWDTVVVMPLRFRDQVLGTLDVYFPPDFEVTDHVMGFLGTIADQAAVGVENARLFAAAEERVREMETLYRAGEELGRSLRIEDVLQSLANVAVDVLKADRSIVAVMDPALNRLRVNAQRGFSDETMEALRSAQDDGFPGQVARSLEPAIIEDSDSDARVSGRLSRAEGIRSAVYMPIVSSGKPLGLFAVAYLRPRKFPREEIIILRSIAQRAASAIENANLFEKAQTVASLEERQRLARELHDSVSQALYGIALGAKTARSLLDRDPKAIVEPLDYVLQLAEAGLAELRALIFALRPETLETEGLVAAIRRQAESVRVRHGVEVDARLGGEPSVPISVKESIFRIVQETLHNTVKHARATKVTLRLEEDAEGLLLEITDDGIGFDPTADYHGHLGLRSMRERAYRAGGSITIESSPGAGARTRVLVPPSHV